MRELLKTGREQGAMQQTLGTSAKRKLQQEEEREEPRGAASQADAAGSSRVC